MNTPQQDTLNQFIVNLMTTVRDTQETVQVVELTNPALGIEVTLRVEVIDINVLPRASL